MLEGTLDDFTLADVLRLVGSARRTGRLDVARPTGSGRLWFRDGAVAAATAGYGRRRPAASAQREIEDLVFDLARWELGSFTWEPGGDGAPAGEAPVDVDFLLAEVARRLDELAEIETLVPSEEAVLAWAPQPPEGAVQINITPAEWRVLVLVDGHRPVREIAAAAGLDDLDAMKVLFGLATAGLVHAAGPAPADASPPSASPPAAGAIAAADEGSLGAASDTTDMTVVSDVSDTPAEDVYAAVEAACAAPLPPVPDDDEAAVDRSTAARELAGLFDAGDAADALGFGPGTTFPAPPATPRRVEDDDQVTRGVITRLIDGVKGL